MNKLFLCILILPTMFLDARATGKSISGEFPKGNQIIDGVQYVNKGTPYFDLEEAPVIAEFDTEDNSVKVFYPALAPAESLFFQFIPGDLITIILSSQVVWNDTNPVYSFRYTLNSDDLSKSNIWHFEVEAFNDYLEIYKPENWYYSYKYSRNVISWSALPDNRLSPGNSVSGFGIDSFAPPRLAFFEVWGKDIIIDQRGYDEAFGKVVSQISSEHRGVQGYTLVPGTCPESIEPVEWFGRLFFRLPKLTLAGYLYESTDMDITPILGQLMDTFKTNENHSLDKLDQEINNTITALEPYQNQMEPEAWAFITENLKYVLRHMDIVRFKEYP